MAYDNLYERILDLVRNHAELAGAVTRMDDRLSRIEERHIREDDGAERRSYRRSEKVHTFWVDLVKGIAIALCGLFAGHYLFR